MTGLEWALLSMVLVFGFFMAWNIGANDVANAMGTSVGSRALTLGQAVVLAGIFEFLGAYLVGSNVANTVRKGIFDPNMVQQLYPAAEFGPRYAAYVLACGMIAALLAAGSWLMLASYFGWPVSTTHSIVGAVVGFGCISLGAQFVKWGDVGMIALGWIVSPMMSGAVAYLLFRWILKSVFFKRDPVQAAKRVTPWLVSLVLIVLIGVVVFKGLKNFWKARGVDPFEPQVLLLVAGVAVLAALIGQIIARYSVSRIAPVTSESSNSVSPEVLRALNKASVHLRRVRNQTHGEIENQVDTLLENVQSLHDTVQERVNFGIESEELRQVERIFVVLQVLTACFVAFAHGSNDVANAIGPLAGAFQAVRTGEVVARAGIPAWALALGGTGIVIGLATWGWRVIRTVGERITELTPSRGFCAEFAAALVILFASLFPKLGLPISTTHTLVGAVLGVGFARGLGALNLGVLKNIVASWLITIPAGATLCVIIYLILKFVMLDSGLFVV